MVQVLLPKDKTKQLFSASPTRSGADEIFLALEDNGVILTLFVSTLSENNSISIEVQDIGDADTDITSIESSPTLTKISQTPYRMTVFPSGSIKIRVSYSGPVTYYIRAKSISNTVDEQQAVVVELLQEANRHNKEVNDTLIEINANLTLLVNHVRLITGVNDDEGDVY